MQSHVRDILRALRLLKAKKPDLSAWPLAPWDTLRGIRRVSPLTLRILAVNVMALGLLVGSLLYLSDYQTKLIEAEIDILKVQARLSASAIAEGAIVVDHEEKNILSPLLARLMIRRLVETGISRMFLFDENYGLLADSNLLSPLTETDRTYQQDRNGRELKFFNGAINLFGVVGGTDSWNAYAVYPEQEGWRGERYEIVRNAMSGTESAQLWRLEKGGLLLSIAVPVQRHRQIFGVLMVTKIDKKIEQSLYEVRMEILKIFGGTLLVTVLFSFYLARTISRPLKRLSKAAETVRLGQAQAIGLTGSASFLKTELIPDFSARNDEIGDLSVALKDMTAALARRISAIENFAADVAHEIKNPLTSLRSAVETAVIVRDPARQETLLTVIREDVDRLDRLITDISKASRLDAELTRDEMEAIDLYVTVEALVSFYTTFRKIGVPVLLAPESEKGLKIAGVEERLAQVLQNLIDNAASFSPPNGVVLVTLRQEPQGFAEISVDDDGPGIPENKLEAVFDRFYSERPEKERFGLHSGLGLSISKQIVQAHRGAIRAENRKDTYGKIVGARFLVRFPLLRGT